MAGVPNIAALIPSLQPGFREVDGGEVGLLAQFLGMKTNPVVTATPSGTAANGVALQYGFNKIGTVGTTADSCTMPPAVPGGLCVVWNGGANSSTLYGQQANTGGFTATGDQLCASNTNTPAAVATGVALASAAIAIFYCFTGGVWKEMLTA